MVGGWAPGPQPPSQWLPLRVLYLGLTGFSRKVLTVFKKIGRRHAEGPRRNLILREEIWHTCQSGSNQDMEKQYLLPPSLSRFHALSRFVNY